MTTATLHQNLSAWARRQFPGSAITIKNITQPPGLLDHRALLAPPPSDNSGVVLHIDSAELQFAAWLPVSGEGGSWCACAATPKETTSSTLPTFTDEPAALALLTQSLQSFDKRRA